ncbi:hypothetical protein DVS77_19680 [Mycolicibacterium moriokaense]|nr:hypothetical protein DVS77_19680 [Mycolicibacterium moriokaense]
MTPDLSGAGRSVLKKQQGRHRAPRRRQQILVRTIGVGGVACAIGLVAEMNAPDADALSIILPAGNGNATQINILEGNVFDPQLGLGGNGSNTSHNSTIGSLMFGLGNNSAEGTSGGSLFGPIVLGGATGNGNVTQVNILSYNIINPQFSIQGGNLSQNTTISNVAVNNGNDSQTTTDSSGGFNLLGGAIGNGNTTQLSFFSGNIFNPQFSLFGDNVSNNTAITNVSALNGNGSETSVAGGNVLGTGLFGMTGNGNTYQIAGFTSNIFNPQVSLLGTNESNNYANANQATGNGSGSDNAVDGGSVLGGVTAVGDTGNGNTTQNASGSGNIYNNQWRLGLGNFLPSTGQTQQDQTQQDTLTNEQVTNPSNTQAGLSEDELLDLQDLKPGSSSSTGTVVSPRPLTDAVTRIKSAVDNTLKRITSSSTPSGGADKSSSGDP